MKLNSVQVMQQSFKGKEEKDKTISTGAKIGAGIGVTLCVANAVKNRKIIKKLGPELDSQFAQQIKAGQIDEQTAKTAKKIAKGSLVVGFGFVYGVYVAACTGVGAIVGAIVKAVKGRSKEEE